MVELLGSVSEVLVVVVVVVVASPPERDPLPSGPLCGSIPFGLAGSNPSGNFRVSFRWS